jgi:hypothetical protein
MAKATTPDAIIRLWADRGAAAADTVRAGVNAVQESPTQKAAMAADKWLAKLQQSKQKFIDSLNRVSLQQWKQAMLGKGLNNMSAGYNDPGNQQKFLAFMRAFLPYVRSGAAQVKAMPKVTLQDGINRAIFMIRWNADFRTNQMGQAPMPRPTGG